MALVRGNSCFKHFQSVCLLEKSIIRNMCSTRPVQRRKPILYGDEASPPVRFAMITASLVGVDIEFHTIDLFKHENRSEFFKKINPLQKVPALSANGEIICDSHAIALYFCRMSDWQEMYPEPTMLRTKVDEWMFFNAGYLFPIDSAIFPSEQAGFRKRFSTVDHIRTLRQVIQKTEEYNLSLCLAFVDYEKAFDSIETWAELQSFQRCQIDYRYIRSGTQNVRNDFFSGIWPADAVKVNNWYTALDHLERKLKDEKWLTGERMRLCDVCCGVTVSSLELLVPLLPRHQNVKEWLMMMKSLTCFEVNKRGLERLQSFIDIKNLLKT